ncbi:TonB-dependent receptor [Pelagicoccus albus]|uniref:TonB-dependent receptor n=1 Tax=Pelagicoccus albus TaxID=415222 RepID=A0A7X1B628_9BACT|nr:TonB-dependent receptor plug domain-containing protein [Pelagicoccus albus]MBC2606344.1 TonB-dependent receptor [Pelagicoccus albus]
MRPVPKLPTIAACMLAAGSAPLYAQSVDETESDEVYELESFTVTPLEELSNRAIAGETPVAFSELSKDDLDRFLASQDIPVALNYTPSVYATNQGGGAGDARVNVRGFDQRNVAVMINGVPVNDMENGWVYWSNWDGIGDVASSIQLQRGTSNLNLAVPSIGGTLNILTDPASKEKGGLFKQEIGSDGFSKTTLIGHTGLINDKFAASAAVVRKTGDSYMDGVWTDAWAWYLGASYKINEANTIELYGMGAPQRHGQNLYQRNIGTYDADYALSLSDYDAAALDTYYERGYSYNETWNYVSEDYDGLQVDDSGTGPRKFSQRINERENFYDKPLVSVNWYFRPEESSWSWDNVLYYSGGTGGGTGTYGSVARVSDFGSYLHRNRDWDAEIAQNAANLDSEGRAQSTGILRNSRNDQWQIGAISKATYEFSENWKTSFGLDWRTAEITHYREVRDLLGGDYYVDSWVDGLQKTLGGIIDYHNVNTVDWIGAFGQASYEKDAFSGFAMLGLSQISYSFYDYYTDNTTDSDDFDGYQIKFGGRYDINDTVSAYANFGYVEKVPIFDTVINDSTGEEYFNPPSEVFSNVEIGVDYVTEDGKVRFGANIYRTNWTDRAFTKSLVIYDGTGENIIFDEYVNISGVDQRHQGIEFEGTFLLSKSFKLDTSLSLNDWVYTGDVSASIPGVDSDLVPENFDLYIDGLKVGDAPQTQLTASLTYMPKTGLNMTFRGRHNRDHYADFDPLSRTDSTDRAQSWEIPDHTVFDLHFDWVLPTDTDIQYEVFASVLNVFDENYIQDATDNDYYNAYDLDHDADDAAVFFGSPRRYNVGLKVAF